MVGGAFLPLCLSCCDRDYGVELSCWLQTTSWIVHSSHHLLYPSGNEQRIVVER